MAFWLIGYGYGGAQSVRAHGPREMAAERSGTSWLDVAPELGHAFDTRIGMTKERRMA